MGEAQEDEVVARNPSVTRASAGAGLVLIAIAFAGWAFHLGDLTEDQRRILLWALSLASGAGAAVFAGGIAARLDGFIPGVVITATGGFAVWCLSFFFLFPNPNGPAPKPIDGAQAIGLPPSLSFQVALSKIEQSADVTIVLDPSCSDELRNAIVPSGMHRGESVKHLLERVIQRTPVSGIGPVRRISDARFEIDCS